MLSVLARSSPFLARGGSSVRVQFTLYRHYSYFKNLLGKFRGGGEKEVVRSTENSDAMSKELQQLKAQLEELKEAELQVISKKNNRELEEALPDKNQRQWKYLKTIWDKTDVKKVISIVYPEKRLLGLGCGFILVNSLVSMYVPFSIGKIIDVVSVSGSSSYSLKLQLVVLGGVFVIGAVSQFGRVSIFRWISEKVINGMRKNLYATLLVRKDLAFFDKNRTGDLLSRISSDTTLVGKALTSNVGEGLKSLVQGSIGGVMMFLVSPKLSLILLSILPPLVLTAFIYGGYVKRLARRTQAALAESVHLAEEKLSNMRTVKAFSQETNEVSRYTGSLQKVLGYAQKEALAAGGFTSITATAANASLLVVLWTAGNLVQTGMITVGDLSSFLMYTVYLGASLSGISTFLTEMMKGLGASTRIFEIMDQPNGLGEGQKHGLVPTQSVRGAVVLDNVSFSYPSRLDAPVLNQLNLSIPAGEVLAIVGASGSGKSTLLSLLLKLYTPDNGQITVDDIPLSDLDPSWWHSQVSIVPQDPPLFTGSIAQNIAYGTFFTDESIAQNMYVIREAASQANALAFIDAFPAGFDTQISQLSLSGGQRQRLAIARAFLKNPKILLLDEPTSSLDPSSESLIAQALERLFQGRTVIFCTHRFDTLKMAHRIAVVHEGAVVETGSLEELSNSKSLFFNLMMKK